MIIDFPYDFIEKEKHSSYAEFLDTLEPEHWIELSKHIAALVIQHGKNMAETVETNELIASSVKTVMIAGQELEIIVRNDFFVIVQPK